MTISQSFHIGTGNHNIANGSKLGSVSKHNERLYKNQDRHNPLVYNFFEGTINDNVRKIYRDVFQPYVDEYNSHQKRADRRIDDYFTYIGNDKRQNIATEIILQYGTKEFWEQYPEWKTTDREQIMAFFRSQLVELDKYTGELLKNVPGANLNVAQATLHFDEASPHLHIIAVPSMPSKRHVKLQPNKSLFFANERLEKIHEHLREKAIPFFEKKYKTQVVKLDEPKRSYVEISEYKKQKELAKEYELKINDLKNEFKELEQSFDRISKERNKLYAEYTKLTKENTSLNSQNKRLEGIIDVKKSDYQEISNKLKSLKVEHSEIQSSHESLLNIYNNLRKDVLDLDKKFGDISRLNDLDIPTSKKLIIKLGQNETLKNYIKDIAEEIVNHENIGEFREIFDSIDRETKRQINKNRNRGMSR